MESITLERLQYLQQNLPPMTAGEGSSDMHIEPVLQNGMSEEYRAFLKDDAMIDQVLSETLELLD